MPIAARTIAVGWSPGGQRLANNGGSNLLAGPRTAWLVRMPMKSERRPNARLAVGRLLVCVIVALCVVLVFRKSPTVVPEAIISGETMGTTYRVVVVMTRRFDVENLQHDIDAELARINEQMSTYMPESEISRFNSTPDTAWRDISLEFARVVANALRIGETSGGAFDITIAPLVNRWNFGPERANSGPPDERELDALKQSVGMHRLAVRLTPPALRKLQPTVEIDLSAIAKGFAVDRVSQLLASRELPRHLIEIGGEIRARGRRGDSGSWTIGIERPLVGERRLQRVVELQDAALATSGDYRNFVKIDGKRLSHIIDPTSGAPVTHNLASVSVITRDCETADAWATALLVLGQERGLALAERRGLAALFLRREESQLTETATSEFRRLTSFPPPVRTHPQ